MARPFPPLCLVYLLTSRVARLGSGWWLSKRHRLLVSGSCSVLVQLCWAFSRASVGVSAGIWDLSTHYSSYRAAVGRGRFGAQGQCVSTERFSHFPKNGQVKRLYMSGWCLLFLLRAHHAFESGQDSSLPLKTWCEKPSPSLRFVPSALCSSVCQSIPLKPPRPESGRTIIRGHAQGDKGVQDGKGADQLPSFHIMDCIIPSACPLLQDCPFGFPAQPQIMASGSASTSWEILHQTVAASCTGLCMHLLCRGHIDLRVHLSSVMAS